MAQNAPPSQDVQVKIKKYCNVLNKKKLITK